MSRKLLKYMFVSVMSFLMVSCGSTKNTAGRRYHSGNNHSGSSNYTTFNISGSLAPQSKALLSEAKTWIGTPYKYGGEDKSGVDCSGLVVKVYKSALDIKLPRNSGEQARYCSPLDKNQLMPGDLLFFATSGSSTSVSHVGIYVGDGKMIHSSASNGVVVSDISSDYYVRTFAGAGSVDKYREMVSNVTRKKQGESVPVELSVEIASKCPSATQETSPGYSLTPVKKLPKKKDPKIKNVVKPVTSSAETLSKTEPTPKTARDAVLNALIEQKIDSIFNR